MHILGVLLTRYMVRHFNAVIYLEFLFVFLLQKNRSISRSHVAQCSQLHDHDEEAIVTSSRQWILDTIAKGTSQKQADMVTFLVSTLLCQHQPTSEAEVFSALLALSHIDFLNQGILIFCPSPISLYCFSFS